jgi:hypothetical protein
MQDRLDRMTDAMTIRRQTVEHPFGTPQGVDGWYPFLDQDARKGQYGNEPAGAYNMKQMIKIFGVKPLMTAIAA